MDHKLPVNPKWERKKTPESSMVAEIAYNEKDKKLYVHFSTNNSVYEYVPVEKSQWDKMIEAPSPGSYFSKHISGNKKIKFRSL